MLAVVLQLLVTANAVKRSLILFTLMMEAIRPKRWLLHEPKGVTSQKTAFFIVIAVRALILVYYLTLTCMRDLCEVGTILICVEVSNGVSSLGMD
jgi:hypothetical protein